METKFQTSFIPKKPITTVGARRSGGMSLLLLVSVIIFLISLGLAGYVYLSKTVLIQKIKEDQASITKNKSGLVSESTTIESLIELNSRIKVANTLISKHIKVSPIFDFLKQATLRNVRFKTFSFSSSGKDANNANLVSVQMAGQAKDWQTVASQADEFNKPDWSKIISQQKITNLVLNSDGSISFSFSANITPSFLTYTNTSNN